MAPRAGRRRGLDHGAHLRVSVAHGDVEPQLLGRVQRVAEARIIWADDLPKTRSGKSMRRLLRDVADGRELGDVTTLRDPVAMADISAKVAAGSHDEEWHRTRR